MLRIVFPLALIVALAACSPADAPAASSDTAPTSAPLATASDASAGDASPLQEVAADGPVATVFKSPTCGCCSLWGRHLEENGFTVVNKDRTDMTVVKDSLGVPGDLGSCHTAVIDGYVIEGHVPAASIQRLLDERPDARGLAVPGMPLGSPGMEQGDRRQSYDVFLVDANGEVTVFDHIEGNDGQTG